jgi:hypothetical protein
MVPDGDGKDSGIQYRSIGIPSIPPGVGHHPFDSIGRSGYLSKLVPVSSAFWSLSCLAASSWSVGRLKRTEDHQLDPTRIVGDAEIHC